MDVADLAAARQGEINADALRERQRTLGPALSPQESAEACESCGDEIPEERRVAVPGVTQCVDCQANLERIDG